MKLHDLKPAAGSRRRRTRVGRGIAAGQGKTAGRGTKGQKARAGASIPGWFEGGQTPIHVRVPKLRGFKNRFKVEFAVVNVGQISAYAEAGRFGVELEQPKSAAKGKPSDGPVATINAEVLAQAGLIRGDDKPLKVLGQGDVSQKLFVAADAFSASARRKIEAAGGFVQLLNERDEANVDTATERQPGAVSAATAASATADEPEAQAPSELAPSLAENGQNAADTNDASTSSDEAPSKPRRRASKSAENA